MPTFLVLLIEWGIGHGLRNGLFVPLYVTATVTSDAQSLRRPVAVWFL